MICLIEMPKQDNGLMWGFQLWINLPAKDKMVKRGEREKEREREREKERKKEGKKERKKKEEMKGG